ncbi:MAG: hypothetical protein JW909_12395 [Planctomycetes bacterium]|nr:hypothetical protein [Planctomycetota bacterium]
MAVLNTTFEGSRAVELTTRSIRLVAVCDCGPRIAFFGAPGGDNLLLWAPGKYTRGDWDLRGGHRVWMTRPGADESEDAYAPDNEHGELETREFGFRIIGAPDPVRRIRRGIDVRAVEDDRLHVDNFIMNTGDMLTSCGVWAITCTVPLPGTSYAFTVGDGSGWDSFSMVFFKEWAGHHGRYDDPQLSFRNDLLVVNPAGNENKRMLQSRLGIAAMSDPARDLTFAKRVAYRPGACYPLGCNMAFYIGPDNFMVELETMGPENTLRPGESSHNVETWLLRRGPLPLEDSRCLIELF